MKEKVEYFYIIEHIRTGKRYCGSKYAKYCHHSQLLNPLHSFPYYTSSNLVKALLKADGMNSFVILKIKEFPNGGALEYEHRFLRKVVNKNPDGWLNDGFRFEESDIPQVKCDHETLCRELGMAFKARRIELGLTQTQVACGCGIIRQKVSQVEKGSPVASISYYAKIAGFLKCKMNITLDLSLVEE